MIKIILGVSAATCLVAGAGAPDAEADPSSGWAWDRVANGAGMKIVNDRYAAFHEELGLAVVLASDFGEVVNETWTWDGKVWTQLGIAPPLPPGLGPAMTYDAARGEIVLFGGYYRESSDNTWVWDGGEWEQRFPETSPSARYHATMAYDPVRERVVLVGGSGRADAWEWNGTNWRQIEGSGDVPGEISQANLAFDPVSQTMLLTGGFEGNRNTWELDGRRWDLVDTADEPVGRWRGIATVGDQVVMVGQDEKRGGRRTASYVWDGDDWVVLPARGPTQRMHPVVLYDPELGRAIVHGGSIDARPNRYKRDTWLLTPPTG